MSQPRSSAHLWISTGMLIVAASVIFPHVDDLSMWFDELWSMFQNNHSLSHILRERELNWPVGYAVTLYGWTRFAGSSDVAAHTLGALIGMLGTAFMIQAGRTLVNARAGWLAGLLFGTSGYTVYYFLEVRGYGLQLAASAALICFMARWLHNPTWARAIPYALAQIILLYAHFTSGLIVALAGAYALVFMVQNRANQPRAIWWRWCAIMAVTGLAFLPALPQFWDSYQLRSEALSTDRVPAYFLKGPEIIYRAYSLHHDLVWGIVLALAGVGVVAKLLTAEINKAKTGENQTHRFLFRHIEADRGNTVLVLIWLALWGLGIPVYAYLTRSSTGLFTTRYLSFTVPAVLLLVGIGLAALPRRGWLTGAALLVTFATLPWQPFDHRPKYSDAPPVRDLVRYLAQEFRAGDMLVIDPSIDDSGYDWWYYEPLYFPGESIPRAKDGNTTGSRVWYLTRQGSEDPAIRETVERDRIPTRYWGPWYFIVTLYEGSTFSPGILIGDSIRFRGWDVPTGRRYLPGDQIRVLTWWGTDASPGADYSLGLHLLDAEGNLIGQNDSGPLGSHTPPQTSSWEPNHVYRDERAVTIPYCLASGQYQIGLVMYQWWDGAILLPEANDWAGPDNHLILDTIWIESFSYCADGK